MKFRKPVHRRNFHIVRWRLLLGGNMHMFMKNLLFCQFYSLERVSYMSFIAEDLYILFRTDNYDVIGCYFCRNKHISFKKVFHLRFSLEITCSVLVFLCLMAWCFIQISTISINFFISLWKPFFYKIYPKFLFEPFFAFRLMRLFDDITSVDSINFKGPF